MGRYFNPGNNRFQLDSSDEIYVDKTGLLNELNRFAGSAKCCVALSHARRFGKTQAAGMIEAYYSSGCDSKQLFSRFEIAETVDFEKHLNKYNVIHVDMAAIADFHKADIVDECIRRICADFKDAFGEQLSYDEDINLILDDIYNLTQKRFVIIIDEWDYIIRNCPEHPEWVHRYLQFLHALFKSPESRIYLALAYITGILPIKKVKDESALNNFREYSMISSKRFTKYFGFTEDEVKNLCEKYCMEYESVKRWYNGYLIDGMHMYNPNSVYLALTEQTLESYWKNTSSFETINDLITLNMENLKEDELEMLEGKRIFVNTGTFKNDLSVIRTKDEALTALIHLGYLGYDSETGEAFIPNFEVSMAFHSALSEGQWAEVAKSFSKCRELLLATLRQEADKVAELVELAHDAYASVLEYNNENALSCAVTMAYFTAPAYYNIIREFPSGKGFADIVMLPRADAKGKPAIVIELKWNQSADAAIKQIKDRRYMGSLSGFAGEILLVGISYDKDDRNKKHHCVIEKWISN